MFRREALSASGEEVRRDATRHERTKKKKKKKKAIFAGAGRQKERAREHSPASCHIAISPKEIQFIRRGHRGDFHVLTPAIW